MSAIRTLSHVSARLRAINLTALTQRDYSLFVRVMKVVLPTLSLLLLGVVVLWARLTPQAESFKLGYAKISADAVKTLSMVNARYFGVDEGGHPYSVTSDRATQEDKDADLIDLVSPKADFSTKSGAAVLIAADMGVFHQRAQVLDLTGNVSLYHEQGYELHTEKASVDMKDNNAWGDLPVEGQGPQGHIEGQGFRLSDKGERVLVTGRSSMTLQGARAAKGQQP